jgi:hypothetical protein
MQIEGAAIIGVEITRRRSATHNAQRVPSPLTDRCIRPPEKDRKCVTISVSESLSRASGSPLVVGPAVSQKSNYFGMAGGSGARAETSRIGCGRSEQRKRNRPRQLSSRRRSSTLYNGPARVPGSSVTNLREAHPRLWLVHFLSSANQSTARP